MSINDVNSLNKAELVKLALAKKGVPFATAQKPSYLTMNGSIFNAPKATTTSRSENQSTTSSGIALLNQSQKLNGSKKMAGVEIPQDYGNVSASEGRAMAKDAESSSTNVKSSTKETESNTKQMNTIDKNTQKQTKALEKSRKNLDKQLKKETKEIVNSQKKIQKEMKSISEKSIQIQDMQHELEVLKASGGDQARIQELSQKIGQMADDMVKSGNSVELLQARTGKRIATMNRVTYKNHKYYIREQKSIDSNISTSQKIKNVAQKIDDISQTVATVGGIAKKVGTLMIAAGAATSWFGGAGSALITVGKVVKKVGTVAEMVGNYGSAAANITKTACCIAEGDLAGALTSAGTAIATGASAISATKNFDNTMKTINAEAKNAKNELTAGIAAKETVKDMNSDQLGGMTKKEARKALQAQILTDGGIKMNDTGDVISLDQMRQNIQNGTLNTKEITTNSFDDVTTTFNNAKTTAADNLKEAGKTFKNSTKEAKALKKETKSVFADSVDKQKQVWLKSVEVKQPVTSETVKKCNAIKADMQALAAKIPPGNQLGGRSQTTPYTYPTCNYNINPQMLARTQKLLNRRF